MQGRETQHARRLVDLGALGNKNFRYRQSTLHRRPVQRRPERFHLADVFAFCEELPHLVDVTGTGSFVQWTRVCQHRSKQKRNRRK